MKQNLLFNAYLMTRMAIRELEKAFTEQKLDIQSEHYLILKLLKENGEQLQIDLSRDTIKGKTFITRAVVALEERKLLKRRTHKDDGRAKLVSLTKKGEAFFEKAHALYIEIEKKTMKGIPKKDQSEAAKAVLAGIKNLN